MKKFIALFIVIMMAGAIFVGCKSNPVKSETSAVSTSAATVAITDSAAANTTNELSTETSMAKTTETSAQPTETSTQPTETASSAWTIVISGINSKDINFTSADAAKMTTVELSIDTKKNDGAVVVQKWTGIPLIAILNFYGANDYDGVKVENSDGPMADLDMKTVGDSRTILGLKLDGQPLSNADGLTQLIVKNGPSKLWVKAITKITLKG
jgi:DMSO/TMAO reductase YedYZ molybdopterin-dependent catalytic subunit